MGAVQVRVVRGGQCGMDVTAVAIEVPVAFVVWRTVGHAMAESIRGSGLVEVAWGAACEALSGAGILNRAGEGRTGGRAESVARRSRQSGRSRAGEAAMKSGGRATDGAMKRRP